MQYKTSYDFFNGAMKIPLNSLPPEAWTVITGGSEGDGKRLWASVAWMYRCIEDRASTLASIPWQLKRGDEIIYSSGDSTPPERLRWVHQLPDLLYRTAAAEVATGRAYWRKEESRLDTVMGYKWMIPYSITPKYSKETGDLSHFERNRGTNRDKEDLRVEDVVYFWPPDFEREIGPAKTYPAMVAMRNAGVLDALDTFAYDYFKRGMIKATLLKYLTPISPAEAEQVKSWWRRVFAGIGNAFSTQIIRGDFEPMQIGEGVADLSNNELTKEERRSIEVAFGLPETRLNQAANLATKRADNQEYLLQVIKPHADHIQAIINDQALPKADYEFTFDIQAMPDLQTNENERSESLVRLVNAGLPLVMALDTLGYDLDDTERAMLEAQTAGGSVAQTKEILGYHIEQGVVSRNEARASVGLEPQDDTQERAWRELRAKLDIMTAARNAGLPPSVSASLVGLEVPLPDAQPAPMVDDEQADEERATLRRWALKRIKQGKPLTGFDPDHLTKAEVEKILSEYDQHDTHITFAQVPAYP